MVQAAAKCSCCNLSDDKTVHFVLHVLLTYPAHPVFFLMPIFSVIISNSSNPSGAPGGNCFTCLTPIPSTPGYSSSCLSSLSLFLIQATRTHLFYGCSGSRGCAALHGDTWFQVKWDSRSQSLSITDKEMIPIILACQVWGSSWGGLQVFCHSDNQSVIADLWSRTSKHRE